jgi:hypothetical protein
MSSLKNHLLIPSKNNKLKFFQPKNSQNAILIFQSNKVAGGCSAFSEDMESVSNSRNNCVIGYKEIVDSWAQIDIDYTINQLKSRSRIIVLCFDDVSQQRRFAIQLQKAGMDSRDYVYLIADVDMQNEGLFEDPFWEDINKTNDGNDELAWKIAQQSFFIHVDTTSDEADGFKNFSIEVVRRMGEFPFYCQHCLKSDQKVKRVIFIKLVRFQASAYANTL